MSERQVMEPKFSRADCERLPPSELGYEVCKQLFAIQEQQDELQTQIYIISGVLGGVLLIAILLIIVIFCKLINSSRRTDQLEFSSNNNKDRGPYGDEIVKRGYATYTGPPIQQQQMIQQPQQGILKDPVPAGPPPPSGGVRVMGYDNSSFDPSRLNNPRVLPRDPPPGGLNKRY